MKEVSIIIPFKGTISVLFDTIDSIKQQEFKDLECIIIDDTNNFEIKNIDTRDVRIRVIRNSSTGASAARNCGLQNAKGKYVIFLDADDLLAPWSIHERVAFMNSNPHYDFGLFPALEFHYKIGDSTTIRSTPYHGNELELFLTFQTPFAICCPIWRKEALEKFGGWEESAMSWQDPEFHIRALLSGLNYTWGSTVPDVFLREEGKNKITSNAYKPSYLLNRYDLYANTYKYLPLSFKPLFGSSIRFLTWNTIEQNLPKGLLRKIILGAYKNMLITKRDAYAMIGYLYLYSTFKAIPGLKGLMYRLRPLFVSRRAHFKKIKMLESDANRLRAKFNLYSGFTEKYVKAKSFDV